MTCIRLRGVGFAYRDDRPVLHDVSVHFDRGWTALTGPNGSGKTTLLEIVLGLRKPDVGVRLVVPADPVVALCRQSVEELEPAIEAFGRRTDGDARRLRDELDLRPVDLERWPTLSPGERKRWQVATALADTPDVLALDEPTNHLDVDARRLLSNVLTRYDGVGIVVSHDRRFLEALSTSTVRVEGGAAQRWSCGFAEAATAREQEQVERARTREARKSEVRKLATRVGDRRREREQAESKIGAGARARGPKDSDARSMGAKIRVAWAEAGLGRAVGVARGKLDRATARLTETPFDKALGRDLFVDYEPAPTARIATLQTEGIIRGDKPIARPGCLTVERASRIRLAGPNGSGKSTLLRALLGGVHVPRERCWILPQEIDAEEAARTKAALFGLGHEERGEVLGAVAALGVRPAALLASDRPSPGEARKLSIAFALARRVWALFLDEPENHLDLESIERLEEALRDYPGALVLVTHDDALASGLTHETWSLPMV